MLPWQQNFWTSTNRSPAKWGVTISRFPYPVFPPPFLDCPFVSRLPPFIVFLLLSCKSRCLTPYSNRECFGLSRMKIGVVNRTTSHSPARSLKRHSFDTTLHHTAKSSMFCARVVRIELPGRSSIWKDFSPPHRRIRDRSKWSLTTFYLARFVVLTENFDSQRDRRDTDTTDTVDTRTAWTCVMPSYSCPMM